MLAEVQFLSPLPLKPGQDRKQEILAELSANSLDVSFLTDEPSSSSMNISFPLDGKEEPIEDIDYSKFGVSICHKENENI